MFQTCNIKEIHSRDRGKGLAVTQHIPPDSILIHIQNPFVLLPDTASLNKSRCVETLKKCSHCKVPRYCSSQCQRADWKYIHAKECRCLKKLPDVPPTPVRALMRVLLKHQLDKQWDPLWANLDGHENERITRSKSGIQENWEDIFLQTKAAMAFTNTEGLGLEMGIAILCRISCNAFRATLPDTTPIGICFEPKMSLVNHSCRPNAHVVSEGRIMTLRSLIQIGAGEELFISYIDVEQPRISRRNQLWQTYFFWCECPLCKSELYKESPEHSIET
ncbi:SET domain and MYND-type zinc finger protein 6 [Erysiphe necator]|nr:SET domain and MYND-type zinc finger protein 6 [Erysiphe necator]